MLAVLFRTIIATDVKYLKLVKMMDSESIIGSEFTQKIKVSGEFGIDKNFLELPEFADETRIKNAQKFFRRNYFSMMSAMYFGLLSIIAVPSILKILIHTKKSSSAVTAYHRYIRTVFNVLYWFREDFKKDSKAWKSIEYVRKMHNIASDSARDGNVGIISQRDMAITQFGFIGFTVMFKEQLSIDSTQEEMEDYCHFWRVLGRMMGIKDEFNLCHENFNETLNRLEVIRKELLPHLTSPPERFEEMSKYAVSGLQCFNPPDFYQPTIFLIKRLIGVKGYEYLEKEIPQNCDRSNLEFYKLNWFNRYMLWNSIMIRQFLVKNFIFRWFFNFLTHASEFFIKFFPIIAIFRFGPRNAYVKLNL